MMDGQPQGGADFRAILNAASDVDSAADAVLNGGEKAATEVLDAIDPAEAWAEIPRKVGGLLALAAPELAHVYTDKACTEWGRDMHRLAVKRGWSTEGLPPEVAATISSAGLLLPTIVILKAKRDAMRAARAAQAEAARESQQSTGGESVGQAV